ncbi:MAG TPA: tetratricopeptide repeat protein [Pyrinomonadaceae bacterium]|jgi:tetratricopeptide (TPR) repeat protein
MIFKVNKQVIFAVCFSAGLAIFSAFPHPTAAHGGLHEQIAAVTKEIKKDPKNPALYLKRAELNRLHLNWKNAEKDYDRAEKLNPNLSLVDFGRAKLWLDAKRFSAAKRALERFLTKEPDSFEAVLTLARVLSRLNEKENAVKYFTRAISLSLADSAEIYLERAQTLAANGKIEEALRGLDEGIELLGELVVLQTAAVDLELKRGDYNAALARLDKLIKSLPRKESFLLKRGEILHKAGKKCAAQKAFIESFHAIDALPDFQKSVRAIQTMKTSLQKLLKQTPFGNCQQFD